MKTAIDQIVPVRLNSLLKLVTSAVFLLCLLVSPAVSQIKSTPKAPKAVLDESAQELADEYTDIVEKLQDLIIDYSDYLGDIGDKALISDLSFDKIGTSLKSSAYQDNPDQLLSDIDAYLSKLNRIDRECGSSSTTRSAKGCRVVRSLLREMDLIGEQLQSYQEHLEESSYSQEQVRKALKNAFKSDKYMNKEAFDAARKAMEQAAKELQRIDLTAPQAPHGVAVPTPPTPVPSVRSYTKAKKGAAAWSAPAAGTQRSANGFIRVESISLPVYISNPNGSIEVTGTSENQITASLDYEISSSSRVREKALADSIGLQLLGDRKGYTVAVTVPRLSDPQTQIARNALVVEVPSGLRLICKASYGDVSISGMTNAVEAVSSYASLDISDCSAGVKATNSMGQINLSDCGGDLLVQNSYAGIELSQCSGTISITNAYAPVAVSDSRGKIMIFNTGEVSVSDHAGPLAIINQYGPVTVTSVQGEVSIQNAYQEITAQSIDGHCNIENSYSPITVSEISGSARLTNRFAAINAEDLTGPFDVTNQNGEVAIVLGRMLTGPCSINTAYAPVRLDIPRSTNFLIFARTSNGEISSSFPVEKSSNGAVHSGIIRLGSPRDSISMVNLGAAIEISASR